MLAVPLVATLSFLAPARLAPRASRVASPRSTLCMDILSSQTGVPPMDPSVLAKYLSLPMPADTVQAEYVWIDADQTPRSKCRTIAADRASSADKVPLWTYDGSSTGQAPGEDSEVILQPKAIYKDPFRPDGNNILVMCDTYDGEGTAIPTNTRYAAAATFAKYEAEVPWYGLEQEYQLFNADRFTPLGWPRGGFPGAQGPYYCGAGASAAFGRAVSDAHYAACRYAGIQISGTNGEVCPGQWEFQVGPCVGIDAGDQLWMARYLLNRICEEFNVVANILPKPIKGYNGQGCHTNFSTKRMREEGGLKVIKEACDALGTKHKEHIAVYGEGNADRLTGQYETCSIDEFKWGVADRGCSIRIPRQAAEEGKGYLEDRRPASNADPYVVTAIILDTVMTC